MLEANIDDMNPELYTYVMGKAFEKGAYDVFMTPTIMKKNRPGIILSILCGEDRLETLEELVFLETTTLGLRKYMVDRTILDRRFIKVSTKYGEISVKLGYLKDKCIKFAPEFEECKKIAEKNNIPIKDVYQEANTAMKDYLDKK